MIENTDDDFIQVQKIWFGKMWFDMDLISFRVIWFDDLNKSQLSVSWPRNNEYFVGVFTAVELNC